MKRLPLYLLLLAPVWVLARQVTNLWQLPWWAGMRFAGLSFLVALVLVDIFWDPLAGFTYRHTVFTNLANLITGTMLTFMLVEIGLSALIRDTKPHEAPQYVEAGQDIYFIVLDSYTSSTGLLERFGYDNSWFYQELTSLGFQVGDCESKYATTGPSLGSLLNGGGEAPQATWLNWRLVQRSQLRKALEKRGYDTIAFPTGFDWQEIRDAAYFLEPERSPGLTEFELYVLGSPLMDDRLGDLFRARTSYLLEHLDTAADLGGSQFTFAHIVAPHPPFVFNSDGSPLADGSLINPEWKSNSSQTTMYSWENYRQGYVQQVNYISNAILEPLQRILQKDPDPLIILIGDHGPWYSPEYELQIMCAVYGDLPLEPVEAVKLLLR